MATQLLLFSLVWTFLFGIVRGAITCECTTEECRSEGKTQCVAAHFCYSEFFNTLTRGCIDEGSSLLCENRKPKGIGYWPSLYCCKDKNFCNRDVVPSLAPDTDEQEPDAPADAVDPPSGVSLDNGHVSGGNCKDGLTEEEAAHRSDSGSAKVINPIYIAVPVAGVCVLLALIIFAMYLLRRRNDHLDSYHHYHEHVPALTHAHKPGGVGGGGGGGLPLYHHHHHCDCVCKKNLPPCSGKVNRCTESERSSSGSETKLFLQA